jgi:hypothetical protein
MFLSVGVKIGRVKRLAVFRPEIKSLPNLDAAVRGKNASLTTRTPISCARLAEVSELDGRKVSFLI